MIMAVPFAAFFGGEKHFCAPTFLAVQILRSDFFRRNKTRERCAKISRRKIKNPLGCEWVGIFCFIPVITNLPLAPYLGGTQNRNQYE
jgi:hypothetical protein